MPAEMSAEIAIAAPNETDSPLNALESVYELVADDFAAVNEVYGRHLGDHRPARATVAVKTLPKNVLVEIDAIAEVGA